MKEYEHARKELSHLRQHTPSDLSKSLSHWEAGAELSASSFGIASLSWSPMPLGKEDVKQSNVTKKMRLWVAAVRLNVTNAELRSRVRWIASPQTKHSLVLPPTRPRRAGGEDELLEQVRAPARHAVTLWLPQITSDMRTELHSHRCTCLGRAQRL